MNEQDPGWKQVLPKDLDSEDLKGHTHILQVMEMRAPGAPTQLHLEIWVAFLTVMTHASIVDCLSVDTYVGSLYTFMSGSNGTRAIPFFRHVCERLVEAHTGCQRDSTCELLRRTMNALSDAVAELLRREKRARFNDDIDELLVCLDTATEIIFGEHSLPAGDKARRQNRELHDLVDRTRELVSKTGDDSPEDVAQTAGKSKYIRQRVIPGGRHDNDNSDITEISIFPTVGEIMCQVRDFLPSTDLDQLHHLHRKTERHIDTHFRLLRHDIFGELKDALSKLMSNMLENNKIPEGRVFGTDSTRINSYSSAVVINLELNSRRGFQMSIAFRQPHQIRKKSTTDINKWWEESKRLMEGVLLSYIWVDQTGPQHLFLTVTGKEHTPRVQQSTHNNIATAIVIAKLASNDRVDIEKVLGLSRARIPGVLLEYAGVLPATFAPVLESLQGMQRQSRLPFADWILPDRQEAGAGAILEMPPPQYASRPGFKFSLDPIVLPGQAPITIPSRITDVPDEMILDLETKTGLDRGQALALVAALTREFALIQGPPGTGKTHLGVKLMLVLLALKQHTDLGPILIV